MFSDDPADWIEYEKKQLLQVLGRLTPMITGTVAPYLACHPEDDHSANRLPAQGRAGVHRPSAALTSRAAEHRPDTVGKELP
ncbi:hypothetical protein ADK75_13485 [Streptomyces virginiae]|uniref:Uncharacterized protein n=1 Tax=Streptomyces virginiae TaxID=1961 RepID=A0A0L8MW68_STRVG|nr:hypothetical protein [Streptomyces virginiae]KOG54644.1 hypothetical protein ADK75_13485 [Streptomyces virginiae]